MAVLSWPAYLVTCWTASSPCLTLRCILCVALASMTMSLICSGTCIGYGFRKEYSSDWPYWLSVVVTTRCLRILLTSSNGLTRWNHGINYGPVPVHAWSFREPGSAPSATNHFVWLSHVHGTVFLPASPLCHLSRDNLKNFYLPNPSHQFNFSPRNFCMCPRSYRI